MPIYDFSCSSCGWKGDRIIKPKDMDARDAQRCEAIVEREPRDITEEEDLRTVQMLATLTAAAEGKTDPAGAGPYPNTGKFCCEGRLVRDEIALTSRQSHAWSPS